MVGLRYGANAANRQTSRVRAHLPPRAHSSCDFLQRVVVYVEGKFIPVVMVGGQWAFSTQLRLRKTIEKAPAND